MCPPVPPPAISRCIWLLGTFLHRLTRDRYEDPYGGETDDQRRPAGADERERDPGHGQEGDDDADVDERLDAQPGGDPGGKQSTERVGRPHGRPDASVGEDEEQEDHGPGADQPELLTNDGEDEVVPGIRQVEASGELRFAEARPEQPAEAQGEETLDRVEAGPERVLPRIEERADAGDLVVLEPDHDRRE